jgi:class 3 adenylate cyclase/pimeloyl-ACP methyl ester carboxylesterase
VATVGGGAVAYQVVGDGPVDMLVVKPAALPIDLMWEEPAVARFLHGLESFSRSIWFDSRGSGASDGIAPDEGRLGESIVDDMVGLVDALELERVVVLSLNSPSTPSLIFAATHSRRTSRLVLVEPIVRFRRDSDFAVGLSDEVIDWLIDSTDRDHPRGDALRRFAPSMADNDRYLRWAGQCARLATTPYDTKWRMRASLEADARVVLPSIHVPTLGCWQDGSPLADQHQYVMQQIEHAETCVLSPSDDRLFFLGDVATLLDRIEAFVTGSEPQRGPERALMTVMFVDIVESTEHVAAMGDHRWRELLTAFEAAWRSELERHRGAEVRTMGDGFVATFDGPGRALRCAKATADSVRSLGIDVRIGMHAGEIELRDGDIGGIAVHIAARVGALAAPREVLVTSTVRDLVAGSGIAFDDRGKRSLKGVPGEWSLLAVESA